MKKTLTPWLLAITLAFGAATAPALAADNDPLFVNLTTEDAHRANMGISFGGKQMERGHPLTIFLNDRAVLIASRPNAHRYGEHQLALADLITKGATVLVCPMCMKHYGVKESDLLPGLRVGSPEVTGGALFKDGTRALSW